MRAIVVREPGGPEVLELRRLPLPEPGRGEVRVRVAASGINRADLLQRRGAYPAPPGWPAHVPGLEFAGVVDALGEGVDGSESEGEAKEGAAVPEVVTPFREGAVGRAGASNVERASTPAGVRVGDRVMGIVGGGGYAEAVVVHARELVPIPRVLSIAEAGAVPEVFMTTFDALILQMKLVLGETVLVHAVGSGVGTAALQLARVAGARVIGTSRTDEKLTRAGELGLDRGVHVTDGTWPESVLDFTGGRGADVILDLVGAPYLAGNQTALAHGGRMIVVGVSGGWKAETDLRALMTKRASIVGTVLRARPIEEKIALARAFATQVVPLLAEGRVRPVVDAFYGPERIAEAHERLEASDTFGKLVLSWD